MDSYRIDTLGFPVTVQPSFLIPLGVFALFDLQANQPLWSIPLFSAIVFVSILIHELGHALTCRALRIRVGGIFLHGMGGHVTHARSHARNNLMVSLAGPGAGLSVGLPVMLYGWYGGVTHPAVAIVISQWVFVNVGWSLLNLLPMPPLDGGQALASLLEMKLEAGLARRTMLQVGLVTGLLVAVGGWSYGFRIIPLIGAYVAYTNLQALRSL